MPTTEIKLDERRATRNDEYPVILYVYHMGKKKVIPLGMHLEQNDWINCRPSKKHPSSHYQARHDKLSALQSKAEKITETLGASFTIELFVEKWKEKEKRDIVTVKDGFQDYINQLRENDQIGTAITYECAINKIDAYAPGILMKEVTKDWLEKFEKDMKKGIPERKLPKLSNATIGYYLRNLKSIINTATYQTRILPEASYPFSKNKNGGYVIPVGTSSKEALNDSELEKLKNYSPEPGSRLETAKNWLLFIYNSYGINPVDICNLRWNKVKENHFTFIREKTKRTTKKNPIEVKVVFTPQLRELFNKLNPTERKGDNYVFPFLKEGMNAEQIHHTVQDFIKRINRGAKDIAKELEFTKKMTPYVMRHTYVTRSIKKGVNPMLVSKNLAHQDFKTTQIYIGGFNDDELSQAASILN